MSNIRHTANQAHATANARVESQGRQEAVAEEGRREEKEKQERGEDKQQRRQVRDKSQKAAASMQRLE